MQITSFIKVCIGFNVLFLLYLFYFHYLNHYFPPPIHSNPIDFFGDFFNTVFWALKKDNAYTIWSSVYHPILLMAIYSLSDLSNLNEAIYPGSSSFKTSNFIYPVFFTCFILVSSFILLFVNLFRSSEKFSKEIYLFSLLFLSSPIFIFTIERLNLIFLAIIPLLFLVSSDSKIIKSFNLTILIILKPYFIALLSPLIFKERFFSAIMLILSIAFLVIGCDYFNISLFDYLKNYLLFLGKENTSEEKTLVESLVIVNYSPNFQMSVMAYLNLIDYKINNEFFGSLISNIKIPISIILVLPLVYFFYYYLINIKKLTYVESYFFIIIVFVNFFPQSYNYFLILYLPFSLYIFGSNDKKFIIYFILLFSSINGIVLFDTDINYSTIYKIDFFVDEIYSNLIVCTNVFIAIVNYLFLFQFYKIIKRKYK